MPRIAPGSLDFNMSPEKIILFDIPSRDPVHTWSLNPWKTRMVLNYKGLEYETHWTEYPDIKPTIKDHVDPDANGGYTIPTIALPDGTWIMDSYKIATALEARYPNPPLHLDSPIMQKLGPLIGQIVTPLFPVFLALVPPRLLSERSQEYWYRTRKEMLDKGPDPQAWEKAAPFLKEATELLKETDGPFFAGKEFSYADIMWIGLLLFWRRIGDDVYEKFLEGTGDRSVHLALLEAAKEWTERDDH